MNDIIQFILDNEAVISLIILGAIAIEQIVISIFRREEVIRNSHSRTDVNLTLQQVQRTRLAILELHRDVKKLMEK